MQPFLHIPEFCHILIRFDSYLYGVFYTIIHSPQNLSLQGPGGGLVRRICSLADGKRSTADIHTEKCGRHKERVSSADEQNAIQTRLFVCLFASFCKPYTFVTNGGYLRQSTTTTYQLVHDWLPYVRWFVKTHDDGGAHFWVAQIRDIIIIKVC